MVKNICNDTLKGLYVVNGLGRYKTLENLQAGVESYKKYFVTDSIEAKFIRFQSGLATYAKGEKAYNFSYPNLSGKNVSLVDLKGKVVLVDTWATWCRPCLAEIPHLKKLEEELKGKNIAIVSISMDEEKDQQKWKDYVVKENLGGIQLYAKGFSEFAKYYKINAIPRFLVFDQEGKIVTVDAPRPSTPELKELLLKVASEQKSSNP
jgi:peroxiredoxin